MGALSRLTAIFDRMLDVMFVLAGFMLMFAMISISVAIATRYFLDFPLGWVIEVSSYTLLYMTFLVAAWVLRDEGHIAIDVVITAFSPRVRYLVDMITSVVSALVFLILTWVGAKVSWNLYTMNYFTETLLEWPKWIFVAIISFGSLTLAIQFLRRASVSWANFTSPERAKTTSASMGNL